jgi:hypothetical protein
MYSRREATHKFCIRVPSDKSISVPENSALRTVESGEDLPLGVEMFVVELGKFFGAWIVVRTDVGGGVVLEGDDLWRLSGLSS